MLCVLALGLLCTVGMAYAGTFVSFNGQFHFTYPESWQQVDYRTADYYLNQGRAEDETPTYEAVFVDGKASKVFSGQYLILTVDTLGELTRHEIDSTLDVMAVDFHRTLEEVTADSFLAGWDPEKLYYDSTNRAAAVVSELPGEDGSVRFNLMAVRFHKHGIANFYFYCPAEEFAAALPAYKTMVLSLSNENLQDALPHEKAKVAKVDGAGNTWKYLALAGGLLAIIVVAILVFRKKPGSKAA